MKSWDLLRCSIQTLGCDISPPKKKPSAYHTHSTSPSREVHRPGCTNSLGMQQITSCCMTAKRSWLVPTEDPTTILCGVWNDLVHLVEFPRMLSFCLNLRIETVGKVRANSSWAAFLRWCWQSEAFRARIHSRHSQASCQPELLSNRVSSTIAVATDCENYNHSIIYRYKSYVEPNGTASSIPFIHSLHLR